MFNLQSFIPALKITWLRRLYHYPHAPYAKLAQTFIGPYDMAILLLSNYSKSIARKMDNKVWNETTVKTYSYPYGIIQNYQTIISPVPSGTK